MKKDNSNIYNIIRTILMVIVMLVVLVGINKHNKKEDKVEEPKVEEKKEFRNSEIILWESYLNNAKKKNLINEDNLESIELISIVDYGKYKKKTPNIRYENINYKFTCKDKTLDCVDQSIRIIEDKESIYTTLVEIDLKDKTSVKFLNGCSFSINDELISYTEPFVYEGEES